ncbi:hypothetical protein MTO98_10425 [Mucilaginibacter sp. SMC90]|uniref:hypothetical protein n=1 Tax=Mucilaginibacter sp. SMC90 TaxID=2929803 RepID=UPI001FB43A9A|nr:hypothetical protein [Mucilaginibacter sp. SMC90]UOE51492.1 hypothetical protein MTO98_10425 [Mucilaginibacter sp. SMC90]
MKSTITKVIAGVSVALALFTAKNVKAQTTPADKWRLGIGLEVGRPIGNAHDISNFELGGTARLQYGLSIKTALTLTSGYYNLFGKSYSERFVTPNGVIETTVNGKDLGIIPVKLGIKSFLAHRLYFGAEAGAGFETTSLYPDGSKDTKLILSPTIGYATKVIDLGLRYEGFFGQGNSYGLIGLRIAYGFGL